MTAVSATLTFLFRPNFRINLGWYHRRTSGESTPLILPELVLVDFAEQPALSMTLRCLQCKTASGLLKRLRTNQDVNTSCEPAFAFHIALDSPLRNFKRMESAYPHRASWIGRLGLIRFQPQKLPIVMLEKLSYKYD